MIHQQKYECRIATLLLTNEYTMNSDISEVRKQQTRFHLIKQSMYDYARTRILVKNWKKEVIYTKNEEEVSVMVAEPQI